MEEIGRVITEVLFLSYSRMEILSWLAASYYLLSSSYAGRVDSRTWKADPAAKSIP